MAVRILFIEDDDSGRMFKLEDTREIWDIWAKLTRSASEIKNFHRAEVEGL